MNRGAKIDRLSSPPNAPAKFSSKKEIRTGWVPRVAACSPCCRCGSSRLFLDCSWKDAPVGISFRVDRAFALPLGLRGISSLPQLPAEALCNWARVVQLHLAGMSEDTQASSPSLRRVWHLDCSKRVGCSRFPRDPQCFLALWLPTPLAGIVGRVGLLSRPERRSVQRSPWRVGLLFRSEELTVRRSPCRRAFARRRQEAPLGCASRSRAEALLRFADQPLQVSLSPDRLGQVTTSGPEVLRRGLAGGPAGLSFGLLADTKNAHKRSPPKKICFSKSTLYSPRLQTIVDNQNASLTLCFRRRKSTTSLAWDQVVRRGRSVG